MKTVCQQTHTSQGGLSQLLFIMLHLQLLNEPVVLSPIVAKLQGLHWTLLHTVKVLHCKNLNPTLVQTQ